MERIVKSQQNLAQRQVEQNIQSTNKKMFQKNAQHSEFVMPCSVFFCCCLKSRVLCFPGFILFSLVLIIHNSYRYEFTFIVLWFQLNFFVRVILLLLNFLFRICVFFFLSLRFHSIGQPYTRMGLIDDWISKSVTTTDSTELVLISRVCTCNYVAFFCNVIESFEANGNIKSSSLLE